MGILISFVIMVAAAIWLSIIYPPLILVFVLLIAWKVFSDE